MFLKDLNNSPSAVQEIACRRNMATIRTLKGNVSAKDLPNNLMCLCATSPCVAFVRQWLNHGGVKFSATCGHTALPVWPSTLARYYI
jgi:hypothetical protein